MSTLFYFNPHTPLNDVLMSVRTERDTVHECLLKFHRPLTLKWKVPWFTIASIGISYGHSRKHLSQNLTCIIVLNLYKVNKVGKLYVMSVKISACWGFLLVISPKPPPLASSLSPDDDMRGTWKSVKDLNNRNRWHVCVYYLIHITYILKIFNSFILAWMKRNVCALSYQ